MSLLISSGVARWWQIAMVIRNRIFNATYKPSDRIPGEAELVKEFGVSRMTLRQALDHLVDEGLIFRRQGVGTMVSEDLHPRPLALTGYLEDLLILFAQTKVVHVEIKEIPTPPLVQEFLHLGEPKCIQITRIRKSGSQMFSFAQSYLSVTLGSKLSREELSQNLLFEILESRFGLVLKEAFQIISCRRAPSAVAKALELKPGDPVLAIELRYFVSQQFGGQPSPEESNPISVSFLDIRPDAHTYRVRLVPIR
jgi:GntR family transcriptional regulator